MRTLQVVGIFQVPEESGQHNLSRVRANCPAWRVLVGCPEENNSVVIISPIGLVIQ